VSAFALVFVGLLTMLVMGFAALFHDTGNITDAVFGKREVISEPFEDSGAARSIQDTRRTNEKSRLPESFGPTSSRSGFR
jgi:hypothetical protein